LRKYGVTRKQDKVFSYVELEAARMARCIASDDPRLKGN
jgi:hypothetical protein